jgi:diguanylate cyclase (GGDEF)-like protein
LQTDVFIALINPGMALIFSATFFLLWRQRRRSYIAVFGTSFLMLSGGFVVQYFTPFGFQASRLVANMFFIACAVGLSIGALGRHGRRPPLAVVCGIAAAGLAVFSWFLFVEPDVNWRILSINFAFGGIALVLAAELRAVPDRRMIDNLMLGIVLFWGVAFFPRPIVVIWLDGPFASDDGFFQSLYWITLILSATLFQLLFALTAVAAIALDVMHELRDESQTDALSRLRNRRGFEEETTEALRSARRKGLPATLVVCDLDHFKSVNDTYGHACGDSVIVAFAECLRHCAGPTNVVGRIGGEEFAVLIEGGDAATARLFAEGARAAFATAPVSGLPSEQRITASFGVAEWHDGESVASLFGRADQALYEAKKAGRDCVRMAGSAPLMRDRRRFQWPVAALHSD